MQKCGACARGMHERCSWGNCSCYAIDIEGHEDPQSTRNEARLEAMEDARAEGEQDSNQ